MGGGASSLEELKRSARLFDLLGHPVRLAIVRYMCRNREAYWSDIVEYLESIFGRMNPNTVNFHITRLVMDGVLEKRDNKYVLVEGAIDPRMFNVLVEEAG